FELVCERSWIQPMLISLYFIGKMTGALVGGVFSDKFGRKPTFLIFNALQFIVTIAMSFVSDVTTYALALFISGGTSLVNFMAANVLGLELVAPQYRSLVYFFIDAGYSIGYMILPLFAYFLRDWRWFLRATGLIGILYVPYYWLIDESPQWLTSVGNNKKARRIREKMAKFNGDQNLSNVKNVDKPDGDPDQGRLVVFLYITKFQTVKRNFTYFYRIMVCMSYYVIALNANNMGGNRFLNMFYGGLTELAASIIFFMSVDVLGRRNSYSVVMSMAAVSIAVTPFLVLSIMTTMFSKLALSVAFAVIYTYSGELFPTTIRHSILAVLSSMGRVGSMVSPFVIHAGVSGDTITPSLITATLIALSAAAVMLLPETRNKTLPQTAQQATAMK
uniref:Major facilitator superfamily (MFS) profile domain-containing protein n=1 Tax=Ciona savignyi TaxID=51511 RepID=H2Z1T4_CIOSA